jgi:beta-glucanase (GH16 family)
MATPEPPQPPATGRVTVPPTMVYKGELPQEATPEPGVSDRTWRNIALTLGVVIVFGAAAGYIFWPKDESASPGPVAVATETSDSAGPSASGSRSVTPSASASTTFRGTSPSGVTMPKGDIPGWKQTFAEDFNGGDLSKKFWIYEGQPGGDPGGWYLRSHVSQSNGKLVITGSKEKTPNGNLYATGGVSNSKSFSQTYGRFEMRFRMDKGYGIAYALLLWPSDDVWPPEIDIAEDKARNRDLMTATLHYGANDTHVYREVAGDFTQWHTVSVDWSKGQLVYRLDGRVWTTMTSSGVPNTPMSIALQSQAWDCGRSFFGCPNSTTPKRVNLEIDWVVAYSKAN